MQVSSPEATLRGVLSRLRQYGILLGSDSKLPSVAAIVAGEPIRGSWWGHTRGHEIHYVSRQMVSHHEVIVAKLVSRKVTYVHRKLWPALVAVGSSRQSWQLIGLTPAASELLALVDKAGRIRTDTVRMKGKLRGQTTGDAARELEAKLLVHSQEIHTETGAHAKVLETWKFWSKRVGFEGKKISPENAKKRLEKVLASLDRHFDSRNSLPWSKLNRLP